MRFRQGGLIGHPEDYVDEKVEQRQRTYYWWQINIIEKATKVAKK
jgi:hypothetical protein